MPRGLGCHTQPWLCDTIGQNQCALRQSWGGWSGWAAPDFGYHIALSIAPGCGLWRGGSVWSPEAQGMRLLGCSLPVTSLPARALLPS